jgi:transcriptional regulator with XRE-family HTH domain
MNARRSTELDMRIGQLIKERRLVLGLRQEDVARLINVTQHQFQKYESGENRIAASRLVDCAKALSVPVAWFYRSAPSDTAGADLECTLTKSEAELLEQYRRLKPAAQEQIRSFMQVASAEPRITPMRAKRT